MEESLTPLILVVDDSKTNTFMLRAMLRKLGYDCTVAVDGKEAVDLVRDTPFDIVLMDINMPVLNGIEAAMRIRRDLGRTTLPIVAVTAYPESRHMPGYTEANFDDLVTKPIDISVLQRKLVQHIK